MEILSIFVYHRGQEGGGWDWAGEGRMLFGMCELREVKFFC